MNEKEKTKMRRFIFVGLLFLSSCASIFQGTSEEIQIATSPDQAQCYVMRKGEKIAYVASTPQSILIQKTKDDLQVTCSKDGYKPETATVTSDSSAATALNLIYGGPIGWAIDSSLGADNKYDTNVFVVLGK